LVGVPLTILIGAIATIVFFIITFCLPESRKTQIGADEGKSNCPYDYGQLAKNTTFLGNAFQFSFLSRPSWPL
jgi:DHA1 family bicyclomycin/chloramphenicol resistance-like MFS transporter